MSAQKKALNTLVMLQLPDPISTFSWVYICNYVGGLIRWGLIKSSNGHSLKSFLKDKEQMKQNIILGNVVLIPIMLTPMILTYHKYN